MAQYKLNWDYSPALESLSTEFTTDYSDPSMAEPAINLGVGKLGLANSNLFSGDTIRRLSYSGNSYNSADWTNKVYAHYANGTSEELSEIGVSTWTTPAQWSSNYQTGDWAEATFGIDNKSCQSTVRYHIRVPYESNCDLQTVNYYNSSGTPFWTSLARASYSTYTNKYILHAILGKERLFSELKIDLSSFGLSANYELKNFSIASTDINGYTISSTITQTGFTINSVTIPNFSSEDTQVGPCLVQFTCSLAFDKYGELDTSGSPYYTLPISGIICVRGAKQKLFPGKNNSPATSNYDARFYVKQIGSYSSTTLECYGITPTGTYQETIISSEEGRFRLNIEDTYGYSNVATITPLSTNSYFGTTGVVEIDSAQGDLTSTAVGNSNYNLKITFQGIPSGNDYSTPDDLYVGTNAQWNNNDYTNATRINQTGTTEILVSTSSIPMIWRSSGGERSKAYDINTYLGIPAISIGSTHFGEYSYGFAIKSVELVLKE